VRGERKRELTARGLGAEEFHQVSHVRRKIRTEGHLFPSNGMFETQSLSVEQGTLDIRVTGRQHTQTIIARPINGVADDRVVQRPQVSTNLVLAAGARTQAEKREAIKTLHNLIKSCGIAGARIEGSGDFDQIRPSRIRHQPLFNPIRLKPRLAVNQGLVFLGDGAIRELLHDVGEGSFFLADHANSAGVAVQAVDDSRPLGALADR
jgi:hypothetical protein